MKHHTFPDSNIPKAYGAYSHAVVAGDFVFVAGQTARDAETGRLIEGDVAAQTHRCIEIIEAILAECGLTLRQVVRSTVYLSNIAHFDEMNRVYSGRFPAPFPARSTPEVKLPTVRWSASRSRPSAARRARSKRNEPALEPFGGRRSSRVGGTLGRRQNGHHLGSMFFARSL